MSNSPITNPPNDKDLLPELVMPFSEPIKVQVTYTSAASIIDLEGSSDTEILIAVNGTIQLKYRGNPKPGYRQWVQEVMPDAATNTYYCLVTTNDTDKWRGLVQAYVKRIQPATAAGYTGESPYTIVPLFIAKQLPDDSVDIIAPPPPPPPPPPPASGASIILSATANCNGSMLELLIDAQLTNTSGTVILEINRSNQWEPAQIFTGVPTRNEHWQPPISEDDAPYGFFQLRMRDGAYLAVVSNLVELDIPRCSFDRYEFINPPIITCNEGSLFIDVAVRYIAADVGFLQLECYKDNNWHALTVLNTSQLSGTGEIHISNRNISILGQPPTGSYMLRARNNVTQRYAETMVYITSCNEQ